jgi:nitrogen fixation NifU-like protein
MDMYREQLMDHYHHPRGWGLSDGADYTQEAVNQTCGDAVTVQIWLNKGVIGDMRFMGHGCAISLAAASLLTEFLRGKRLAEVADLKLADVQNLLGGPVTPGRIKCALLALGAVQSMVLAKA